MPMINMKRAPEREEMPGEIEKDEPRYPYGLCISLEKEDMDKLGLSSLPKVGTEVSFIAKAVVKGTSAYETQGGSDMRVELQITDMEMKADQTERNNAAASMLYSGQAS